MPQNLTNENQHDTLVQESAISQLAIPEPMLTQCCRHMVSLSHVKCWLAANKIQGEHLNAFTAKILLTWIIINHLNIFENDTFPVVQRLPYICQMFNLYISSFSVASCEQSFTFCWYQSNFDINLASSSAIDSDFILCNFHLIGPLHELIYEFINAYLMEVL